MIAFRGSPPHGEVACIQIYSQHRFLFSKMGPWRGFPAAFHVLLDSADAALVVLCSSPTKTYKSFYAAAPAGS